MDKNSENTSYTENIKTSSAPEIRFKGFTEDWEQRKLGDVVDIYDGVHQTPEYKESGVMFLSVENIQTLTSEKYISEEAFERDYKVYPKKNDILMTRIGDIGTTHVVADDEPKAYYVSLALLKHKKEDAYFLSNAIQSNYVQKGLRIRSLLTAVPMKINKDEIGKVDVFCPKLSEQKKIGAYFQQLDRFIALHQRKCEKLKALKSSMLTKMFPKEGENEPEIRFEGFTGAWEQRKWIDMVDISTEMVNPGEYEYADMPHIAPGNIESFTGRILDNVKTVKEEQLISGKFRFRPNDVVYGKINPQLGKYFFATVNGLTSADAYVFNGKNGLTQKYLFYLLQTQDFFKYSVSVSKRSGMPKINRDELNAYEFLMPSYSEQLKIGDALMNLDHLITLHQRKYEKLLDVKKALLEKMIGGDN